MSKWICLIVLLGACGKADEALKSLEGVKAAVCGCKPDDADCAKAGLEKVGAWHAKNDQVGGAKSQAAKATAHLDEITACQTKQQLGALSIAAGCDTKEPTEPRWCLADGWGDAKKADLPIGTALEGTGIELEVGVPVALTRSGNTTMTIDGTQEAPLAAGTALEASGVGWRWTVGTATIELRHVDGGWVSLAIDGIVRRIAVFPEQE